MFCKKGVLKNIAKITGKHLRQSLFFNKVAACNFIKNKTPPQVFSCEFSEVFKNTFFDRTPLVAASLISFDFSLVATVLFHVVHKFTSLQNYSCITFSIFVFQPQFLKAVAGNKKISFLQLDNFWIK